MSGLLDRLFGRKPPSQPRDQPAPTPTPAPWSPAPDDASASTGERGQREEAGGLAEFFTADHRACDALWADIEAAEAADVPALFAGFERALRRHLSWEEEVLFPEFEAAMGMGPNHGPTAIMRGEHDQMRALLDAMFQRVSAGDVGGLLDQGDTLLMLIQQHNVKEEQILYPMAGDVLAARWGDIAARLHAGDEG